MVNAILLFVLGPSECEGVQLEEEVAEAIRLINLWLRGAQTATQLFDITTSCLVALSSSFR